MRPRSCARILSSSTSIHRGWRPIMQRVHAGARNTLTRVRGQGSGKWRGGRLLEAHTTALTAPEGCKLAILPFGPQGRIQAV